MRDPLRDHFRSLMLPHQRQKDGKPFGPKAVVCACGTRVVQQEDEIVTECSKCHRVWRWE